MTRSGHHHAGALLAEDIAWQHHAACQGANAVLFTGDFAHQTAATTARRYCRPCPVRTECGAFADRWSYPGLWGGVLRTTSSNGTGARYRRLRLLGADDG